jgi:hypothetical protein
LRRTKVNYAEAAFKDSDEEETEEEESEEKTEKTESEEEDEEESEEETLKGKRKKAKTQADADPALRAIGAARTGIRATGSAGPVSKCCLCSQMTYCEPHTAHVVHTSEQLMVSCVVLVGLRMTRPTTLCCTSPSAPRASPITWYGTFPHVPHPDD